MRLPQIFASLGSLLELAWFVICSVQADDDVNGLEKGLAAERAKLKKLRDARNDAADNLVKARAQQAIALLRLAKWLKQLALETTAAFGGKKKSLDYLRIFPVPASKMLAQGISDRVKSVEAVLKALAHPATPKTLTPAIKTGEALLKALNTASQGVVAAQLVVRDRADDIRAARQDWFKAYRSLHAALVQKFPDDLDRVNAYFDKPATGSPVNGETATPAVPGPDPAPVP